jgi:hypothetical protein
VRASARVEPRAFVLGGNANTLAFVNSFRPSEGGTVAAHLVPLAQTPIGTVAGDTWQKVTLAQPHLIDWVDQTFAPDDERAFVAQPRDIELLSRTQWHAEMPDALTEEVVLNPADLPDDVAEALAHPAEPIVQCAACKRLCVRGHFVWRERQLCAWDYHRTVFGRRGPWRTGAYDDRFFETLPQAGYVAPPLLAELEIDVVLAIMGVGEDVARRVINTVLESEGSVPHLAVRTTDGYTLLREAPPPDETS